MLNININININIDPEGRVLAEEWEKHELRECELFDDAYKTGHRSGLEILEEGGSCGKAVDYPQ
jgi:hypothetical protein